jgi:hypothetical protein
VERSRHPQLGGDLAHGAAVLEAERQEQTVSRLELVERATECVQQLSVPERRVGASGRARSQAIRVYLGGDEVLELASSGVLGTPGIVLAARTPVAAAVIIQKQPSRDDDQPGREPRPGTRRVRAQATVVIRPQGLKDVRVAIQCGVTIARQRATGVEEDAAVRRDERGPRVLPCDVVRRIEKARERRGEVGLLPEVVGRGVPTSAGWALPLC